MNSILQLPSFEVVLFITHDIDVAIMYANRVLLVNQGTVVADGPPHEALGDLDRLQKSRLITTSLLQVNLDFFSKTRQFLSAEALAHRV